MIALASDFLLFELTSGERLPFSAEMISVELMGDSGSVLEPEFVKHAAASVFHYFKHELGQDTVSVVEFAGALEKVLRGLGCTVRSSEPIESSVENVEADLVWLANESGGGCELTFFPKLRGALRTQLKSSPRLVRFHGLRGCVKRLAGARRWSPRCESLRDQIVEYLRQCLTAESRDEQCALVVE
jgi:hypothetical protein